MKTSPFPKLSVIVPIYNVEKYLSGCVESILSQEFADFEIIAVDDGSTDLSGKIIDEYAKKDSRIKVFHTENGGVSKARNIGLENAVGEYIGFVDSDDTISPVMYKKLIAEAEKDKTLDIVQCGFVRVYANQDIPLSKKKRKDIVLEKKAILPEWFKNDKIHRYLCTKIIRRRITDGLKFDVTLKFSEDELFGFECCARANKIKLIGDIGYFYLQRKSSAVHKAFGEQDMGLLFVNDIYMKIYNKEISFYPLIECSDAVACTKILLGIIQTGVFREKYEDLRKRLLSHKWQVFFRKSCNWKVKIVTFFLWVAPDICIKAYRMYKKIRVIKGFCSEE